MDSDEFEDGLADEDLMLVMDQSHTMPNALNSLRGTASNSNSTARNGTDGSRQITQQYRQTTLWGEPIRDTVPAPTPANNSRVYRADLPPEQPTHHVLNQEELNTWVYPMNLGPIRDYQYSIVKNGLYNNTLVALPTGLGKTFIAATIMLNWYRWTKDAKMVFVAPTKPLASQQVEACLNIAGIPRSDVTLLTGETSAALRDGEWANKRVFFMTPQTLQNDLSNGRADPKSIVLLVVDEAHRATGDYAYVKVIEFIRRFSKSIRVLALTATPGSSVEGVQAVMDNLGISHIEIRTEESIDIRQYVHQRVIDRVAMPLSDDILHVCDLFGKALMPLCKKLSEANIYWGRDPMDLTTYGLLKAKQDFLKRHRASHNPNQGLMFLVNAIVPILQRMAHFIKLLKFHGVAPFHTEISLYRNELEGKKLGKYEGQIAKDPNFQEMMTTVDKWVRTPEFVSHPKMTRMHEELLNHFMDAGPGSNTKVIVFSEYRASAEHIIKSLSKHRPLLKAAIFVGQADSKSGSGMKQKDQLETMEKFKGGDFNILVATSIGEEGLDIGQVDLIICYDTSASPIRMLQRMGRTGRKRAGKIVALLVEGREEQKLVEAQDNYEKMQLMICDGDRFKFRHDLSTRILPRDIKPEVEKRVVEIPPENSQDNSLPIPKATKKRGQKAAKKKFHMPDDVETGFKSVSALLGVSRTKAKSAVPVEVDFYEEMPHLSKVFLTESQAREHRRRFETMPASDQDHTETENRIQELVVKANRTLHPGYKIRPGRRAKRFVQGWRKMDKDRSADTACVNAYTDEDDTQWKQIKIQPFAEEPWPQDTQSLAGTPQIISLDVPDRSSTSSGKTSAPKPARSRAKAKPKPGGRQQAKKRKQNDFFSEAEEGVSDEDEEEEDEGMSLGGLPQSTRRSKKSKTAGRGRKTDTIEDYGDDCMRTSDNYFSDGSDNGSDLVDFVVGDDEVISSMRRQEETSPTSVSSPYVISTDKTTKSSLPVRNFISLGSTQDSDGGFPELSELGTVTPGTKHTVKSSLKGDGREVIRAVRSKRRRAVMDSSGDDDDDEP